MCKLVNCMFLNNSVCISLILPTFTNTIKHLAFPSRLHSVKVFKDKKQKILSLNSPMDGGSNSSMDIDDDLPDEAAAIVQSLHDSEREEEQRPWRCHPFEAVQRGLQPYELNHLPPVQPSAQHHVLYVQPIQEAAYDPPLPYMAPHRWDSDHVRLPCASESKYPIENEDGTSDIASRWGMIQRALLRPISNSKEFQDAILSYNASYKGTWSFRAIHKLFNEELDESESRVFFEDLLPRICSLALRLPELIQAPIPLLKQNQASSLTLSQEQISCLLANAFLCTYPRRNTLKRKSEYSNFPDINFNRLFHGAGLVVMEKLKCIFHYFRRVCPTARDATNVPTGCVTFERRVTTPEQLVDWTQSDAIIAKTPLHINVEGTIEDQGIGLLQVDFANKFLGGGVLGQGCVQEEIRFVICPELFVSKLVTECLLPTEALLIFGCERYCNYSGYASSFAWSGNHEDCTPCDSSRRRKTAIVAIDALKFDNKSASYQFREEIILRELNKASVGFKHGLMTPAPGVATGNWGCGAFGGDLLLKALIQLMVCAHHRRPVAYYTFGNWKLRDDLYKLWKACRDNGTTVQQLWSVLRRFQKDGVNRTLFKFVYDEIQKLSKLEAQKHTQLYVDLTKASSSHSVLIADDNDDDDVDDDDEDVDEDADDDDDDYVEQEATNAMMLAASLESGGNSSSSNNSNNATTSAAAAAAAAAAGVATATANAVTVAATAAAADAALKALAALSTPVREKRQLTLLEMLDRDYDHGQASSSKRHHQSNDGENKAGKARKDAKDDVASCSNSERN